VVCRSDLRLTSTQASPVFPVVLGQRGRGRARRGRPVTDAAPATRVVLCPLTNCGPRRPHYTASATSRRCLRKYSCRLTRRPPDGTKPRSRAGSTGYRGGRRGRGDEESRGCPGGASGGRATSTWPTPAYRLRRADGRGRRAVLNTAGVEGRHGAVVTVGGGIGVAVHSRAPRWPRRRQSSWHGHGGRATGGVRAPSGATHVVDPRRPTS